MKIITRISAVTTLLATLILSTSAHAVINVYNFGNVIAGTGPNNTNFATLTIDDATDIFTFSNLNLSAFGSGAFIATLAVNYSIPQGSLNATFISGGLDNPNTLGIGSGGGPGGVFDFNYDLFQGQDRLTNGETLSWSSVDFDLSKVTSLAVHVQGVTGQNYTPSVWYSPAAAVPEPETYVMLLAGLCLVCAMSRRRQ